MKKSLFLLAITALIMSVLVTTKSMTLHAKAAEQPPSAMEVKVQNFAFAPPTLTVPVGTQVTWINKDDTVHNIVDKNKAFKSKALDTDEKFSYTFDKPGTFSYFCALHPQMKGTVEVK